MPELSCVSFPTNVWPVRLLPEHTDELSCLVTIKVVSHHEGEAPSIWYLSHVEILHSLPIYMAILREGWGGNESQKLEGVTESYTLRLITD